MRGSNRLDSFYEELKEIHKRHFPDWRFGELCSSFFNWLTKEKKVDLFFPEDDKMLKYIKEYAERKLWR